MGPGDRGIDRLLVCHVYGRQLDRLISEFSFSGKGIQHRLSNGLKKNKKNVIESISTVMSDW